MIVRPLVVQDAPDYVALRAESLKRHPLAFGASPQDDVASSVEFVRARLAESDRAVFGAFDPDLVGAVGVHRNATVKGAHRAYIWGMYVRPSHRRGGVGLALMEAAIAFAAQLPGVRQVHLSVSEPSVAAAALYRRLGFRAWGTEPAALQVDGVAVSETHMVLHLYGSNAPTEVLANRSIPPVTVIPVLAYSDAREAAKWLCRCFGFRERLRIGDHRVQLTIGDGAMVALTHAVDENSAPMSTHSVLLRVADVDKHFAQAKEAGVRVGAPPVTHPYGERQYSAADVGGHMWTFTQSVRDVDPSEWGGEVVGPEEG